MSSPFAHFRPREWTGQPGSREKNDYQVQAPRPIMMRVFSASGLMGHARKKQEICQLGGSPCQAPRLISAGAG
jgi:hypothetical protein